MQPGAELLQKCCKNDRKAHNELYRLCHNYLFAICLRYCQNKEDAAALLNQGFLKIIINLEKYREEVPFNSWIGRVMVNTIIDEYRKDKNRRNNMSGIDLDDVPMSEHVDFNEASENLDTTALQAMIQDLPNMSRTVFNLYAIEGYSHKEIADMLGISDGTSKWHVSFARKTLQEKLKNWSQKLMSISL